MINSLIQDVVDEVNRRYQERRGRQALGPQIWLKERQIIQNVPKTSECDDIEDHH